MKVYWNVVATSMGGHRGALLHSIRDLGDFEVCPHSNVLLGWSEDTDDLLERLRDRMQEDSALASSLGRLVPSEITVPFDANEPEVSTRSAVAMIARRIGGNSYHVRVDARGWGRQLHVHDLEVRLGKVAWDEIARQGFEPQVSFEDPELVIMVEIVGDTAGISLIDRNQRMRFPFMKVS